jgi:hypothetical protein
VENLIFSLTLPAFFGLKIEEAGSSKTLVNLFKNVWSHIQEDYSLRPSQPFDKCNCIWGFVTITLKLMYCSFIIQLIVLELSDMFENENTGVYRYCWN